MSAGRAAELDGVRNLLYRDQANAHLQAVKDRAKAAEERATGTVTFCKGPVSQARKSAVVRADVSIERGRRPRPCAAWRGPRPSRRDAAPQ